MVYIRQCVAQYVHNNEILDDPMGMDHAYRISFDLFG